MPDFNQIKKKSNSLLLEGKAFEALAILQKDYEESSTLVSTVEYAILTAKLDNIDESLNIFKENLGNFSENKNYLLAYLKTTLYASEVKVSRDLYQSLDNLFDDLPLWVYHQFEDYKNCSALNFTDSLSYLPAPKNGSSTLSRIFVKEALNIDTINPHRHFDNPYFTSTRFSENDSKQYFFVCRNPFERLFSYYNGNIIKRKSLIINDEKFIYGLPTQPDFDTFVKYLKKYQYCFNDVHHHTLPQSAYFLPLKNHDLLLIPIASLDVYLATTPFLSKHANKDRLMIGNDTTFDYSSVYKSLSNQSLETIHDFTAADYKNLQDFYTPPKFIY